jgi:hypothetical protein
MRLVGLLYSKEIAQRVYPPAGGLAAAGEFSGAVSTDFGNWGEASLPE